MSAIGLLGVPAETNMYGPMILYSGVSMAIANLITAFTIVPLFHPLRLTSVYQFPTSVIWYTIHISNVYTPLTVPNVCHQYLEMRFESTVVRLIGVIVGMAWTGGIKSVVWTDVFQTVIILVGLVAILIKGTLEVGSTSDVMRIARAGDRATFDDISPDPRVRHTVWGFIIGFAWYWTSINLNQSSVQRISSTRSMRHARLVFLAALPLNVAYGVALVFCGLIIYAYFVYVGCDPLEAGFVTNSNQLMIYFVVHVLGFLPGVSGLYLATVLSGSLSTLSSGLNSLAANTVEDILRRPLSKMTAARITTITKLIVMAYGCVVMGLAYIMRSLHGPVTQITDTALGACGGPVFGLFILGAVFPQANKYGAIAGTLSAMAISIWMSIGGFLYGTRTPSKLPGPTYACAANASDAVNEWLQSHSTINPSALSEAFSVENTTTALQGSTFETESRVPEIGERGFFLYDLSYVWYTLLSSCIAVIIGLIVSAITRVEPSIGRMIPD
nr:hypothetical protein BaRGS_008362 [Batillaria attramentaria]